MESERSSFHGADLHAMPHLNNESRQQSERRASFHAAGPNF